MQPISNADSTYIVSYSIITNSACTICFRSWIYTLRPSLSCFLSSLPCPQVIDFKSKSYTYKHSWLTWERRCYNTCNHNIPITLHLLSLTLAYPWQETGTPGPRLLLRRAPAAGSVAENHWLRSPPRLPTEEFT